MTSIGVRTRALSLACLALACAVAGPRPGGTALPLEGTHWTLVSLGAQAAPIAKTQAEAFLVFGERPGWVAGSGGCNQLAGSYTDTRDEIHFGPIAGTLMACAEGEEVESALHAALERAARFRIEGDRLELQDAAGAPLAAFQGRGGAP